MTNDELKMIIKKHKKWLSCQEGGERADLHGADLRGAHLEHAYLYLADLRKADLRGAYLMRANLAKANLQNADLSDADLSDAYLYRTHLTDANLTNANLQRADMSESYLLRTNLNDASLPYANLYGADIYNAKNIPSIPMACPDSGSFIGWKKANGHIVKLLIPEDARRSSATGRKCRCDKVIVIAIETVNGEPACLDEIASDYDETFIYKVGETVTVPNFCEDRFRECAKGIHFFINRQEAVEYN